METPIKLLYKPTNRHQKRDVFRERKRLLEILMEPELTMVACLFNPDKVSGMFADAEYTHQYQYLLENYKHRCEWVIQYFKPKFHSIDEYYFYNIFKPVEKFNPSGDR